MLSYLSRWASASGLVRSFTATISMSWPLAAAARQKLRPMRPKPLMPTRTVTKDLHAACRGPRVRDAASLAETLSVADDSGSRHLDQADGSRSRFRRVLLREHVVGDDGFRVRDTQILGPLVGHREETPYAAGHRILGHRRIGPLTELLQRRLAELQPQPTGDEQVLRGVVGQDLQRPLDAGTRGHGRTGGAAQVRVVEVGQAVGGGP